MNEIASAVPAESNTLSRSLRPRHVTMIAIGGIVGAGLFVGSSAAIAGAGPAILVTYALTGFLVLLIMRMLGEMAVGMPQIRSFTEFARVGLGNWAGFSVGWLYWFFWVVVVPVEAIAGAAILEKWIAMPTWEIGVVLMAIMTAVNLLSARAYGEFEFWFSSIKVTAIVAFILVAAAYAFGLISQGGSGFSNLTAHGGFAPSGWLAALAAVTTVIFSMMGAEIVTIAAVESPEPARAVARMSSSVITRILIFYVGSILMVLCVVPWNLVVPGESPFTLALDTMHIPFASTIMAWIILTAVLSCLNSAFYVCSRVRFVLAGHGDAPRWLVKTNKRQVPSHSVMLASVAGFAGVIAAILSPSRVFAFLLNASGALIVYIYLAIAVSQVRVRMKNEREGKPPVLPMWLFPWLSYFAIAGFLAVLVALAITPARFAEFWTSAISVAVALAAYAAVRRNRHG
jgi:L-asparagine transporter-like permease